MLIINHTNLIKKSVKFASPAKYTMLYRVAHAPITETKNTKTSEILSNLKENAAKLSGKYIEYSVRSATNTELLAHKVGNVAPHAKTNKSNALKSIQQTPIAPKYTELKVTKAVNTTNKLRQNRIASPENLLGWRSCAKLASCCKSGQFNAITALSGFAGANESNSTLMQSAAWDASAALRSGVFRVFLSRLSRGCSKRSHTFQYQGVSAAASARIFSIDLINFSTCSGSYSCGGYGPNKSKPKKSK